MNRKRIIALMLALTMAFPANVSAASAAPMENTEAETSLQPDGTEMSEKGTSEETENADGEKKDEEAVTPPPEQPGNGEDKELPPEQPGDNEDKDNLPEQPGDVGDKDNPTEPVNPEIPEEQILPDEKELLEETAEIALKAARAAEFTAFKVDANGVLSLEDGAEPAGIIRIPKEAKTIPDRFFYNNPDITIVLFEEGSTMEEISSHVFENCTKLASVSLPASVRRIGESAFGGCNRLEMINLENIEQIGASAFQSCISLKNSELNKAKNLTEVGEYAFRNTEMSAISFVGNNKDVVFGKGAFLDCRMLTTITLPKGMTAISEDMFAGCTRLGIVNTDTDCKAVSIGRGAFEDCSALTKITIPAEVTSIGTDAFARCSSLKTISVPEKVETIEAYAFRDCKALTTVTIANKNENGKSEIVIPVTAFPRNGKMKMRGYEGTVEDYAEDMGFIFELIGGFGLTLAFAEDDEGKGSFSCSATKNGSRYTARGGELVYVTLNPASGYWVHGITVNGNPADAQVDSVKGNTVVFCFRMPEKATTVTADFGRIKEETISYNVDSPTYWEDVSDKKELTLPRTGMQTQLHFYTGSEELGAWKFTLESSNKKVVEIGADGLLRSVGEGSSTIKATLKRRSSNQKASVISFKVSVGKVAEAAELDFIFPTKPEKGDFVTEDGLDPIIRFNRVRLTQKSRDFKVELDIKDKNGEKMFANSEWTVGDTSMLSVQSKTSTQNKNTITVKKGALGETTVTVKVKKPDKTVLEKKFIIQVVDATPRLLENAITVNKLSTQGTRINLVPVYGFAIDSDSLKIKQVKKTGNIVDYDSFNDLKIVESEGDYYIKKASDTCKTTSYSNSLVIEGQFENGTEFRVPVPKLTVVQSNLKPSVKFTGKINLFYSPDVTESGKVLITQSLKKEEVLRYELVSNQNKEKRDKGETEQMPDSFAENFKIVEENGNSYIQRKAQTLIVDEKSKKPVTSGWLYIYYKGYEASKVKITVPCTTTKPSYVLSLTKATASLYAENQEYKIQLLDKKTKKPLELDTLAVLAPDETDSGTTAGLFKKLTPAAADKDKDTITLSVLGTPRRGKAVFSVRLEEWAEPLKFTFNLNVVSSLPTAKCSSATLNLNSNFPNQTDAVNVTLNQEEAVLQDGEFAYKGKAAAGNAIGLSYTDGKITAEITDEEAIKKGSYSFQFTPEVGFTGSTRTDPYYLRPVTVTVKVVDTLPEIKLAKTSWPLNAQYPGKECVSYSYTWKNIPAGGQYELDTSRMELEGTNLAAKNMRSNIEFELDEDSKTASVKLKRYVKGSYSYTVKNLVLKNGSEEIDVKPFKITVQGVDREPDRRVTGKGTLNLIDRESFITYTPKVLYITNPIVEVELVEFDENNTIDRGKDSVKLTEAEELAKLNKEQVSEHFRIEQDQKGNILLRARETAVLNKNITYRVRFIFRLKGMEETAFETKDIKIKPSQTLPRISADTSAVTMYAGERYTGRIHTIGISKTTMKDAVITGVKWGSLSEANKKLFNEAFDIDYNNNTGKVSIKLKNAAVLKMNGSYTLPIEFAYKGQSEKTTGTTIKVKVTIKK